MQENANALAKLIHKIEEVWDREEKYWAERSRRKLLKVGNKSSSFFHPFTVRR